MNGVIGIAHLLADTRLTSQQHHFVATIHSSGKALLAIINDILDFSRLRRASWSWNICSSTSRLCWMNRSKWLRSPLRKRASSFPSM